MTASSVFGCDMSAEALAMGSTARSCVTLLEGVSAATFGEAAGGVAGIGVWPRDRSNAFLKDAARLAPKRSAEVTPARFTGEASVAVGCVAVPCVELQDGVATADTEGTGGKVAAMEAWLRERSSALRKDAAREAPKMSAEAVAVGNSGEAGVEASGVACFCIGLLEGVSTRDPEGTRAA